MSNDQRGEIWGGEDRLEAIQKRIGPNIVNALGRQDMDDLKWCVTELLALCGQLAELRAALEAVGEGDGAKMLGLCAVWEFHLPEGVYPDPELYKLEGDYAADARYTYPAIRKLSRFLVQEVLRSAALAELQSEGRAVN